MRALLRWLLLSRPIAAVIRRLSFELDRALLLKLQGELLATGADASRRLEQTTAIVERALAVSMPAEKQRFHAWVEEKQSFDHHTLAYAIRVFDGQRRVIEEHKGPLAGLRVLELGPGHTLATGLLLHAHGVARYVGADLFPIAGLEASFYRRLRAKIAEDPVLLPHPDRKTARAEALRRFDDACDLSGEVALFKAGKVEHRTPVDAAKLPFEDGSFDVVLSNAAFEHFLDPGAAARECARVLAPGGVGLHQIDLRDHRGFDRPLAFLELDAETWRKLNADMVCYTNRWRRSDFERAFLESGTPVASVSVDKSAPVSAATRAALHPDFRGRSDLDLETLSAFFVCRKG